MKLHLPHRHAAVGNSFGYSRWAESIRRALCALNAYTDDAGAAHALVHITPPHLFHPQPGVSNVLFTAFEAELLPAEYRDACTMADMVVVPSRHNQRVFAAAGVATEICPLGIDPRLFRYVERSAPSCGKRFRYLWVGAPNPRKGWRIVDRAWARGFADNPEVELYIKTTARHGRIQTHSNLIADSRALDDQQLAAIYASAHCFVFPSYGEGFGLTLAEAMATGLPALFTPYGGVCDFANSANAYPLRWRVIATEYFGSNVMAAADVNDLAAQMRDVKVNYAEALARGRRAAAELAPNFTWTKAAQRLLELLRYRLPSRIAA